MTNRRISSPLLWPCLVSFALAAACSDSPATPAPDAGADAPAVDSAPADVAGDASTPTDATTPADATTPTDATPADATTPADAAMPAAPRAVPVSAMGHDRFFGVTYDRAGNFYAVGVVADGTDAMADFRTVVAKFRADGTLDTSFGAMGFATHNIATGTSGEVARGVVVQSTGKIVVAATVEHAGAADARDRDIALIRFNADGTRDMGFGTMGTVTLDLSDGELAGMTYVADAAWGLAAYPDDRLLVTGSQKRAGATDTDFAVIRLSADGARDAGYGTNGVVTVDINNRSASARASLILADGTTVTSGYMDDGGVVKPVLIRLDAMGRRVSNFATNGVFSPQVLAAATEAYDVALQGTSLVTVGYGRAAATESLDWLSLRVDTAGMLDTSYGMSGVARLDVAMQNDNGRSLVVLPDNRVLMVGGGRPTMTNVDAMIAVLTPNGQPDTSYGPRGYRTFDLGGAADMFWGVAVSPDRSRVAVVGAKSVGTGNPGNDDAAVYLMPLQ